jgi:DNA-binding XRE family transcriptional regulator
MKTIRSLRHGCGWTQFDLALAVGVQPQTIYLWEKGQRLPRVTQLRKLGQIFNICSDDIVLEPVVDDSTPATRPIRANQPPGEQIPGGSPMGRATRRGQETTDADHDDR